jgi:hypothetical protein
LGERQKKSLPAVRDVCPQFAMFARSSRCLPAVRDVCPQFAMFARSSRCLPGQPAWPAWPTSLAKFRPAEIYGIRKTLSPGLGGHAHSMWSLKVHPRPLRHKFRGVLGGAIVPAVIVVCFYAWQLQATQFEPYDNALTFKKLPETAAGQPGQPAWPPWPTSLATLANQPGHPCQPAWPPWPTSLANQPGQPGQTTL